MAQPVKMQLFILYPLLVLISGNKFELCAETDKRTLLYLTAGRNVCTLHSRRAPEATTGPSANALHI